MELTHTQQDQWTAPLYVFVCVFACTCMGPLCFQDTQCENNYRRRLLRWQVNMASSVTKIAAIRENPQGNTRTHLKLLLLHLNKTQTCLWESASLTHVDVPLHIKTWVMLLYLPCRHAFSRGDVVVYGEMEEEETAWSREGQSWSVLREADWHKPLLKLPVCVCPCVRGSWLEPGGRHGYVLVKSHGRRCRGLQESMWWTRQD